MGSMPGFEPETPAFRGKVLDTSANKTNGLNRCPSCGSTEISPVYGTYDLVCGHCRQSWTGTSLEVEQGLGEGIHALKGRVTASGAARITDTSTLVTLKCGGCGAEVVINTATGHQRRCHWCRQTLSLDAQVPNGAVPDGILPFYVSWEQAVGHVKQFLAKRSYFASDDFKRNFIPHNVVGVYLPYLVVDGNIRARLDGHGEILKKTYKKLFDDKTVYYDANAYRVYREFDLVVDDLIVESSSHRAAIDPLVNTNNVVNAILPFDVKNMVAFESNFIGEFTSEKRDLDIEHALERVQGKFMTLARQKVVEHIGHYNRGVRWDAEQLVVHGTRWVSVYLPVWLYSHYERQPDGKWMLHYIAVNGRNGQTMGSVPFQKSKLLGLALVIGGSTGAAALLLLVVALLVAATG
ncbi:MAG: hypothetical protein CVT64_04255 [Actinobacteria bacterium HGW-Actinobacteria-4]|nr:MAG: hypothetical protein CVT64_04255 [Actinobacteria bacterium HGW-Actinobacteria-4]